MEKREVPLVFYNGNERIVIGTATVDETNEGLLAFAEMTTEGEYEVPLSYGIPCPFSFEKKEE